jgi:hypothetical protein
MKKLSSTLAVLATICVAQPAVAFEKGDIIARAGLTDVSPTILHRISLLVVPTKVLV